MDGGCANCKAQAGNHELVGDRIYLSFSLNLHVGQPALNGVRLASLEPKDVVPFLQRNLHWRIADVGYNAFPWLETLILTIDREI